MLSWIIFAAIGKLLIFFWMKFPLPQKLSKINFLGQLHSCGLCSGVWAYTGLAALLKINILQSWFGFDYVPVVSELVTGCLTSYVVHLLSLGFMEQHLVVKVE